MTRIYIQNVNSQTNDTVDFKDIISANGQKQWLDSFGIIKACKNRIDENVTIPSGTNGVSAGTITVGAGYTVTIQGEWRVV
jgi:hypothetical protein